MELNDRWRLISIPHNKPLKVSFISCYLKATFQFVVEHFNFMKIKKLEACLYAYQHLPNVSRKKFTFIRNFYDDTFIMILLGRLLKPL